VCHRGVRSRVPRVDGCVRPQHAARADLARHAPRRAGCSRRPGRPVDARLPRRGAPVRRRRDGADARRARQVLEGRRRGLSGVRGSARLDRRGGESRVRLAAARPDDAIPARAPASDALRPVDDGESRAARGGGVPVHHLGEPHARGAVRVRAREGGDRLARDQRQPPGPLCARDGVRPAPRSRRRCGGTGGAAVGVRPRRHGVPDGEDGRRGPRGWG
jgi:hypothetical protein